MIDLSKISYVILPARPSLTFQKRDLYNQAYTFWKEYWQRTFKRKAPDFWSPLDFFRQDFVFSLFYEQEIVAQNIGSFVFIDDAITPDLPYVRSFEGDAWNLIKKRGCKTALTLEYTAVNPNFGERVTGYRFAEIINGLGLETFKSRNIDVTFGTPRKMTGLSEVTTNYGYKKIGENLQKAGWNLDIFLGFRGEMKEHPNPIYRYAIRALWKNRVDYSIESPRITKIEGATAQRGITMAIGVRDQYTSIIGNLCSKFDSLNWEDKNTYGLFLFQAYSLVRHTTRLLSLCAGYCPFEYEETHKRLIEHLREETGHDKIALADLSALGVDVESTPELMETKQLIQMQYDKMKNISALSFFGYILLLEGLAVTSGAKLQERTAKAFGPKCTRFLLTHAHDDIEHIEKALEQVEGFDEDDRIVAMTNMRESAEIYYRMLETVESNVKNGRHVVRGAETVVSQ